MKQIIFNAPFNNLSFGNVSLNLAREFYKKEVQCSIFPIGDKVDVSAFNKLDKPFIDWLNHSIGSRLNTLNKDATTLQMWHINGSETRLSSKKVLYTFHELDDPTPAEINLINNQNHCVFSSSYSKAIFAPHVSTQISNFPIGFDPDLSTSSKKYLPNKIHFGLMGKFEKRKHTEKILKNWAKKYGNNYKYQLSCLISNPFFQNGQMDQLIHRALDGKRYGNINFLPFLKTNSEVNDYINAINIELSGLSGAEGWNLPAFNASALGKWSIVLNSTSHKDWASNDNCVLVNPSSKETAVDGFFFHENSPFNKGNIFSLSDEEMIQSFEQAESKCVAENTEGLKLQEKFSYEKTADYLLSLC